MLNKYYVGGTYTFELALTLTTHSGAVTPTANQVFFNLIDEAGDVTTYGVSLGAASDGVSVYYYTTTTGIFDIAGDWAYYWSINNGTIVIPATDPVPIKVRAMP